MMMNQADGKPTQGSSCSEAMSRLIDGELDAGACRELFDRLGTDDEARRIWVLLNIACDAVRSSETAALHSTGFVSRLSVALAAEPVVLAPRTSARRRNLVRRVVLPTAAIAAAAAVLAVVAVPQLRGVKDPVEMARSKPDLMPVAVPDQKEDLVRSPVFEAYLEAHRNSAAGPLSQTDFLPVALPSPAGAQ
jgi:negative regulator of sigma E activity